jgi:hypothetical protein
MIEASTHITGFQQGAGFFMLPTIRPKHDYSPEILLANNSAFYIGL